MGRYRDGSILYGKSGAEWLDMLVTNVVEIVGGTA